LIIAQHLETRAALRQLVVDQENLALYGAEPVAGPVHGMLCRESTVDDRGLVIFLDAVADDLGALIAPHERMIAASRDVGCDRAAECQHAEKCKSRDKGRVPLDLATTHIRSPEIWREWRD